MCDPEQSSKFFSTLSGTFHFKWKVATPLHFPLWFLVFFHFFFHFLIKFIQFVFSEYAFGQKREIWGWRCKGWLIREYGILLPVLWFITRNWTFLLKYFFCTSLSWNMDFFSTPLHFPLWFLGFFHFPLHFPLWFFKFFHFPLHFPLRFWKKFRTLIGIKYWNQARIINALRKKIFSVLNSTIW